MKKITGNFYNRKPCFWLAQWGSVILVIAGLVVFSTTFFYRIRMEKTISGYDDEKIGTFSYSIPIYKDALPLSFGEIMLFFVLPISSFAIPLVMLSFAIAKYYQIYSISFQYENKALIYTLFDNKPSKRESYTVLDFSYCQRNALTNSRYPKVRNLLELRLNLNDREIVLTELIQEGVNPGLPIYSGDVFYVEDFLSRDQGTLMKAINMIANTNDNDGCDDCQFISNNHRI